jgi:hypothetical protein
MSASVSCSLLPPYFPLVRRECDEAATDFFRCLSSETEPFGDKISARGAIAKCDEKCAAYKKCTELSLSGKDAKKSIVLVDWETE